MMSELSILADRLRSGNESPTAYSEALRTIVYHHLEHDNQQRVLDCDRKILVLHDGQLRGDGAPYVIHPRRVALIASQLLAVEDFLEGVLTSLLHDVVEDCGVSIAELRLEYGHRVAQAVESLSAIPLLEHETRQARYERKEAKVARVMGADDLVVFVHLADKLDNAISWRNLTPEMSAWQKIPRWLWQLVTWEIPIARARSSVVADQLLREVEFEQRRGIRIGTARSA